MQARAQAQFERTDANRDGFLTQAEVQARAAAARPGRDQRLASREQRQAKRAQRLARLDTDRDGTISPAERQARSAARGGDQAQGPAKQAQRLERRAQRQVMRGARGLRINEQRFTRLDTDKDSRLTLAEVTAGLATRFQRLDTNRDGAITREERRSARGQRQGRRNG
jgi:hypothetical protein